MSVFQDQRVRFLIVGATNTAIGYVSFAFLSLRVFDHLRFGYLLSLYLSYAIAIIVAFILYRHFVFKVTGNVLPDFVRFCGVYLAALTINTVTLPFLVEVVRLHPLAAQFLVMLMTAVMSFFGHREFAFRRPA